MINEHKIKLTSFSHGAGCGCKISPAMLDSILKKVSGVAPREELLVGNGSRDDAAVLMISEDQALISTTDFFMPIVDDPYDFGRIAATNAISDIYAMGGSPILAIAILGWPIDKIDPVIAADVIQGAVDVCELAGIPLSGGHSIDSPEPIFGLSVNGLVHPTNLKKNDTAKPGDLIFLTKPLGLGILSTASKRDLISDTDLKNSIKWMTTLNIVGEKLAKLNGVHSMTDVTGFGLLGHLVEMTTGSNTSAHLNVGNIPLIENLYHYVDQKCIPGGTNRNLHSYGDKINPGFDEIKKILADPQTSGGLLISIDPAILGEFQKLMTEAEMHDSAMIPIGVMAEYSEYRIILH